MRVRRGAGCIGIVVAVAACSGGTGSNAARSSLPPVTTTASNTDAATDCSSAGTAQVNGRPVPVADGGSLALSNVSGVRQPLVRDSSGAVLPVKLLWLVKAPPGTTLHLTARTETGVTVVWVDGGGQRSDPLTVSTAAQTEPDASPEWSAVPSLLAVPSAGCYSVTTQVDGQIQTLGIVVT